MLIDFGFSNDMSASLSKKLSSKKGNELYKSPPDERRDDKADIFSVGAIIVEKLAKYPT